MTTMELIDRGIGHNALSDAYDLGRKDALKEIVQLFRNSVSAENICDAIQMSWCVGHCYENGGVISRHCLEKYLEQMK